MSDKDWRDNFPQYGHFGKYRNDDDGPAVIALLVVCVLLLVGLYFLSK